MLFVGKHLDLIIGVQVIVFSRAAAIVARLYGLLDGASRHTVLMFYDLPLPSRVLAVYIVAHLYLNLNIHFSDDSWRLVRVIYLGA